MGKNEQPDVESRPQDQDAAPDKDVANEADDGATPAVDELQLTLQDAQAKADEYWNQLLRVKAELANMQRRNERELENAHKYGLEKFFKDLLPVLDSLEMGVVAAEGDSPDLVKVREGVELTLKMFVDAAERYGLTAVNPAGEPFNPDFHQAMSTEPNAELPANTVTKVFQKGYLLNERLIRPALVVVSAATSGQQGDDKNKKIDEMA